jgi:hypothetical protein
MGFAISFSSSSDDENIPQLPAGDSTVPVAFEASSDSVDSVAVTHPPTISPVRPTPPPTAPLSPRVPPRVHLPPPSPVEDSPRPPATPPRADDIPRALSSPTRMPAPKLLNTTLMIRRTVKKSLKGKHFYFDIPSDNRTKYYAKALSSRPSNTLIPVSTNPDVHMKGNSQYRLRCEKGSRTFALLTGASAELVVSWTLLKDEVKSLHLPDFSKITVGDSIESAIRGFVSLRPKMSNQGYWFLDFHNRFTLPSPRNAIYVQDNPSRTGEELFALRQIEKNILEFDLMYDIPDLVLFTIAVAAFCAKHS